MLGLALVAVVLVVVVRGGLLQALSMYHPTQCSINNLKRKKATVPQVSFHISVKMGVTLPARVVQYTPPHHRKPSATPSHLKPHEQWLQQISTLVASQRSTRYLCSTVYYMLVYNPSRPCLIPACRFHLNQTRSLSPTRIYPLTKHAFHVM